MSLLIFEPFLKSQSNGMAFYHCVQVDIVESKWILNDFRGK
jgi:hypothetical protein